MGATARLKPWATTIAVAATAGVVAGFVILALASNASVPSAQAETSLDDRALQRLAAVSDEFLTTQTNTDSLPQYVIDQELADFVPSTARSLGSQEDASFWIVANSSGEACLLLLTVDEWGASTCQPPDVVLTDGLSVQLLNTDASDGGTRAYLIPDGFAVPSGTGQLKMVGNQLLVGKADAPADQVVLKTANGKSIVLDDLTAVSE